jgi:hypothetical protein
MAFISLGLHDSEPQPWPEQTGGTALHGNLDELSDNILSDQSPELTAEEEKEALLIGTKPANGANGGTRAAEVKESDAENWSATGMQIIQSILQKAQQQELRKPASQEAVEPPENFSFPPELEELRRKISQGVMPDFSVAPPVSAPPVAVGGIVPDHAATPAATAPGVAPIVDELRKKLELEAPAAEVAASVPEPDNPQPKSTASTISTETLSSVMEDIQRKLTGDGAKLRPQEATVSPQPIRPTESAVSLPAMTQPVAPTEPKNGARWMGTASTSNTYVFDLRARKAAAPPVSGDRIPTFATFKFGYLPGRGLLYSIIGHEVAMFVLFLLITYILPSFREQRLIVGSLTVQDHVIYLPEVGGGTEGQKSPGAGESKPQQASAAPAHASRGLAYPGKQAALSNPPNPTNAFQTVMRPLVVHPEALKTLVPLPNIVQMAETRLPKDLMPPKPAMPLFQPPPTAIRVRRDNNFRRAAKWDVPVEAPKLVAQAEMPKLPAAEEPLPQAPKVQPKPVEVKQPEPKQEVVKPAPAPIKVNAEKRPEKIEKEAAPPSAAQVARMEMHGKKAEPLLSLSPAPLPPGTNVKIPAAEAQGRFAIAPGGTLNPKLASPGKPNGAPSVSPATGQESSAAANAATELASNTGTGLGHNPAAGGGTGAANEASGAGSVATGGGSGKTAGAGVGGTGAENGRGNAGAGAGRSGHGTGTGAGAGSGAGSGAFPGITIQGGEGDSNQNTQGITVAQQNPYQITIVATASSGGGLPDFGVFQNERVYTVYLPMQRTPEEADPTWTLQYALDGTQPSGDGQLLAPSPVMREWPQIPADLEKRYAHRQVILFAVLGADGKVSHISVKQTPDPAVSTAIAHALSKWVFHPAQLNNQPVPVKILVGVPI